MASVLWMCVLLAAVLPTESISSGTKLTNQLIRNYKRDNIDGASRPVLNESDTLKAKFGFALVRLLSLDEDSGIGTFHGWDRNSWNDALLRWDPAEFNGVDIVYLPNNRIFKPDIVLYNSFDRDKTLADAQAVVANDGSVLYIPQVVRKVFCDRDGDFFYCNFKFGSWVYDGFKMDLDFYDGLEQADLSDFINSNDFDLVNNTAVRNVKYYPCCAEPYIDLTFSLTFKKLSSWWS